MKKKLEESALKFCYSQKKDDVWNLQGAYYRWISEVTEICLGNMEQKWPLKEPVIKWKQARQKAAASSWSFCKKQALV